MRILTILIAVLERSKERHGENKTLTLGHLTGILRIALAQYNNRGPDAYVPDIESKIKTEFDALGKIN